MLGDTLKRIQELVPPLIILGRGESDHLRENEWHRRAQDGLGELGKLWTFLIEAARSKISGEYLTHSENVYFFPTKRCNQIGEICLWPKEYHIRPESTQELSTGIVGHNYSGLQLSLSVYRAVLLESNYQCAECLLELRISEELSRSAFHTCFVEHKRFVKQLVERSRLILETPGPIERLDRYRGKKVFRMIDLYFEQDDPENSFSLNRSFREGDSEVEFVQTFILLSVLYDLSYRYCRNGKGIDMAKYLGPHFQIR